MLVDVNGAGLLNFPVNVIHLSLYELDLINIGAGKNYLNYLFVFLLLFGETLYYEPIFRTKHGMEYDQRYSKIHGISN